MAADTPAAASGAQPVYADALRRRAGAPAEASVAAPVEADDKKKATKPQPSVWQILSQWEVVIAPIIFTAFAFFTRLYKIGLSDIVTWDEAQ